LNTKIIENLILLILALMLIFTCGCEHRVKKTQFLFGTVADITIIAKTKNDENALDSAFEAMKSTDEMMSAYNSSSEVSKINQNAGQSAVKASQDTFAVIEKALEFSQLSDGAFDVSIGPLVNLWGFGTAKNHVPSDDEIAQNLPLVDYKKIILDRPNKTVKLAMRGMKIDLGAIAVGYAVDKALGVLKEKGIKNALVNGGGEIYALGSPPGKSAWRVGIQHPRKHGDVLGTIDIKDKAISTSGDYENYFEANGKRYCHILNPKTGKSVEDIISVTVVADNTTDADALSTTIMIMGEKKGMELAKRLGVDCIVVTGTNEKDMKISITDGLKNKFKLF
jgi:thiamine biosynthesis lipoprotein